MLECDFEKKLMCKNSYRKFKVINNRNVTTKADISFNTDNKTTELLFRVDVENKIVNKENIKREICDSAYYYFIQYCRLHHSIVSEIKILQG